MRDEIVPDESLVALVLELHAVERHPGLSHFGSRERVERLTGGEAQLRHRLRLDRLGFGELVEGVLPIELGQRRARIDDLTALGVDAHHTRHRLGGDVGLGVGVQRARHLERARQRT